MQNPITEQQPFPTIKTAENNTLAPIANQLDINTSPEFRCLIVDDQLTNRKLLTNIVNSIFSIELKKYNIGINIKTAQDGDDACEKFRQALQPFDVIFMDVVMPNMDGLKATETIRAYEKQHSLLPTNIIGVSSNALPEDKEKAFKAGMNDYWGKPIPRRIFANYFSKIFATEISPQSITPSPRFFSTTPSPKSAQEKLKEPTSKIKETNQKKFF